MAFDWIAGLFQSEQTRGLSGDSASAVALDDSNPYYNYRLRRHKAEGDFVEDPGLLWYTSPYVKKRTGLGTHIAAEQGEGVANFTDVLLILSREDYARVGEGGAEPWIQKASRAMAQEFENFCRREQFSRLYSHRQLGFRILCDGSTEMGGQSLNLGPGEFVSGLLPNMYTGPVAGSFPVIGVHVNLPGVWEGYQEVGRLHNDQILFTLGSNWLDNFCHPSLKEAALYRLQQYPDGSFVHIVNPDLQDRYQVTSVQQGGTNVLTLATRDGQPLAYLVLAVIDPPADAPSSPGESDSTRGKPGIAMPVAPEKPQDPTVAPPMLIDDTLQPVSQQPTRLGSKTIIPDAPSERIFTLQERGALLQKVHFSAFMEGYDVYMGQRGELGTVVDNPAATFQVRKRQVSLKAHIDLVIGGRKVSAGSEVPIEGDTTIEVGAEHLDYRDLRGLRVDGWPYVGEIRRPASSNYMIWGDQYRIGRSRECRVVLPDEPRNDNIHWKASVGDGATIRARTGEIPKSRFYTDSIMVASEHAHIDVKKDRPELVCTARHCYAYVRRHNEVMPLYPATSGRTPQQLDLEPGDEVLIGNCLFHVGFTPPMTHSIAPAPAPEVHLAPEVKLTPDSLVDAVSEPDFSDLDTTPAPQEHRMGIEMLEPIDPVPMDVVSMESVTGASIQAEADIELSNRSSLDDTGPVSMPPLEDVGDDPTSPGMVVPRELLGDDELDDDPLEEDEPVAVPEPDEEEEKPAVPGWDEDDWEEATGPREMPADELANTPIDVPTPFPNLEEDETVAEAPTPVIPEEEAPPEGDEEEAAPTEMIPVAPTPEADEPAGVVCTDDSEAQFELGRPLHLVQSGWTVKGEIVCGNHTDADLIIPENRIVAGQSFEPVDYFKLKVRGRKGQLDVLRASELLINEDDPREDCYTDLSDLTIDVIRRDDQGEEDFVVRLVITQDRSLPDPRARFLALDYEDPLAAALVTRGLGLNQPRSLTLGGVQMRLLWADETLTISDYLDTYKREDGFHPFFIQRDRKRFVTAPEDGSDIVLSPNDRFVVGNSVYLIRGV